MNIKTRIIACLCILSILVSLIALSQVVGDIQHKPEYTEFDEGIASTYGNYFIENWNSLGRIYLLNNAGDVLTMTNAGKAGMKTIHCLEIANDSVYAVYSEDIDEVDDDYKVYKIVSYNPYLQPLQMTAPFVLDSDEEVSSVDAGADQLYITTVGKDGSKVNVYEIGYDELTETGVNTLEDLTSVDVEVFEKPISILYRESEGGMFFVDAYYNGSEVVILRDIDDPVGKFKPDSRVKASVDSIHFNVLQQMSLYSNYLIWWFGILIIWFIVMGIIYVSLMRRNRSLYTYVLTELVFLILMVAAFTFVRRNYRISEEKQNGRYALLAMKQELEYVPDLTRVGFDDPDFYESTEYRNLSNAIRRYMNAGYNNTVFYDIFIMRVRNGNILVGGRGFKGMNASYVYGGALASIQADLKKHAMVSAENLHVEGVDMYAVGMPDDDPSSGYALVAVVYSDSSFVDFWNDSKSVILLFVVVFILGSMLLGLIFYIQTLDMRAFEHAIREVALGRTKLDVPDTPAQDLRSMWNSLSEITKRMEEINYDKFRIFEAYYRFAPKNVETIMGKDSIFDVKNGDMTRVEGTLMLLSGRTDTVKERKVKTVTNIMTYMNRFSESQEGILVSQDSSLSMLRFFFLREYVQTVSTATQFLHMNSSDMEAAFVSCFLYDDSFIYGVAGIQSQSLSFITSEYMNEMEEYARWFRELQIPLVVTSSVAKREDAGQTRYIGYILLGENGERLDLFEAIDAETARLRQLKLSTRDKFEETLELFYSKEYYLARNMFSEILKECPEDRLAKWYLFESEGYLNAEIDPAEEGRLRIGERS